MKKFISALCALAMLCSFASVSVFAAQGSLTLNASYMADDWETEKEEVSAAGDVIAVHVNAEDIVGMDTIGEKCEQFAAIHFTLEYDNDAITPYKATYYESNVFTAKYAPPKKNVPTASTEGIITTGNPSFTSNTDEPGYVPDGKTSMIITEATKGFCLNGGFMTFYFTVVDPSKKGDIKLSVETFKNFDNSVNEVSAVNGMSVAGMGKSEEPVVTAAFDKDAATKYEYDTVYNYGVGGTVTVPEGKSTTGVTFDISNGTDTHNYNFDFGTSIAANTSFGLNIGNVPKDVTLTFSNLKVK